MGQNEGMRKKRLIFGEHKSSTPVKCRIEGCGKVITREQTLSHAYAAHRAEYDNYMPKLDYTSTIDGMSRYSQKRIG